MTLEELIDYARDNHMVTRASDLTAGQLAMIVRWGDSGSSHRRAAVGVVVFRQRCALTAALTVARTAPSYDRGTWWPEDSLYGIEVMVLNPEQVPEELIQSDRAIPATRLEVGQAGVLVEWGSDPSGSTPFRRTSRGCLVVRERGSETTVMILKQSPAAAGTNDHLPGQYWSDPESLRVVPLDIELPYEVEA